MASKKTYFWYDRNPSHTIWEINSNTSIPSPVTYKILPEGCSESSRYTGKALNLATGVRCKFSVFTENNKQGNIYFKIK